MSRIESFPLSYQVLFKYAQISSKNLIEISFKKSYCCVKNVKNAISNHNLKKSKRRAENIKQKVYTNIKRNVPLNNST